LSEIKTSHSFFENGHYLFNKQDLYFTILLSKVVRPVGGPRILAKACCPTTHAHGEDILVFLSP